jgi:hypothetical protein
MEMFSPNIEQYQEQYDMIEKNSPVHTKSQNLKRIEINEDPPVSHAKMKSSSSEHQPKPSGVNNTSKPHSESEKKEFLKMMSALFDDDDDHYESTPFRSPPTVLHPVKEIQNNQPFAAVKPGAEITSNLHSKFLEAQNVKHNITKPVEQPPDHMPNDKIIFQFENGDHDPIAVDYLNSSYSTLESANLFPLPQTQQQLELPVDNNNNYSYHQNNSVQMRNNGNPTPSFKPSILTDEFFEKNNLSLKDININNNNNRTEREVDEEGHRPPSSSSYHQKYHQILSSLLQEVDQQQNNKNTPSNNNNKNGNSFSSFNTDDHFEHLNTSNNSLFANLPLSLQQELQSKKYQDSLSLLKKYKTNLDYEDPRQLLEKYLLLPTQDLQSLVLQQVSLCFLEYLLLFYVFSLSFIVIA